MGMRVTSETEQREPRNRARNRRPGPKAPSKETVPFAFEVEDLFEIERRLTQSRAPAIG